MPGNNTTYNVGINVKSDVSDAKRGINDLKQSLNSLSSINTDNLNVSQKFKDGVDAAKKLQTALQDAVNVNTGKLDLSKFNKQIKSSGETLTQMSTKLIAMGPQGQQTFQQLANAIMQVEMPLKQSSKLLDSMFKTLGTTIKYSLSYGAINMFTQSVREAVRYAENLNGSLNNIRIVTGQSTEQMNQFAKRANQAAKELRASTLEYTNASLIYYQQGLSDAEVKERTDATIKMANVTKDGATEVSSYMTAIWNNFDTTGKKLEYFGDVVTALGAKTASSSSEIAGGLEKFAAVADTIGLSYEYAAASLATIVAKTRQSEDVVGTALKTIFSRMEGLKLGQSLEDGTDLNKYSAALASVGVNIKEANGELKTMDEILDETGERWRTLTNDQQVALAQSVAGIRQYSQFIALMDNWNDVKVNVDVALDASGTLDEQQKIYEESWEAASKKVQTSWETLYSQIINDEDFIGFFNGLSKAIDGFTDSIERIGGISPILMTIASSMMAAFGPKMAESLQRNINNIRTGYNYFKNNPQQVKDQIFETSQKNGIQISPEAEKKYYDDVYKNNAQYTEREKKNLLEMNDSIYQQKIKLKELQTQYEQLTQAIQTAKNTLNELTEITPRNITGKSRDSYAKSEDFAKLAFLDDTREQRQELFESRIFGEAGGAKSGAYNPDNIQQGINKLQEYRSSLNEIDQAYIKINGKENAATKAMSEEIQKVEAIQKGLTDFKRKMQDTENPINSKQQRQLLSKSIYDSIKSSDLKNNKAFMKEVNTIFSENNGIANGIETIELKIKQLITGWKNVDEATEEHKNTVEELAQKTNGVMSSEMIEEKVDAIHKGTQASREAIQVEEEERKKIEEIKKAELSRMIQASKAPNISETVMATASLAMNMGTVVMQVDSLMNQIKEGNASLGSFLMTASMLTMSIVNIFKTFSQISDMMKIASAANIIAKAKETDYTVTQLLVEKKITEEEAKQALIRKLGKNKGEEVAGELLNKKVSDLDSEQTSILEGIMGGNKTSSFISNITKFIKPALIGAISGLVVGTLINSLFDFTSQEEKLNKRIQQTEEQSKKLKEAISQTRQEIQQTNNTFKQLEEFPDTLSKMTKGTYEYTDAIRENNANLKELLKTNNAFTSDNYMIDEEGIMHLTANGKNQITQAQQNKLAEQEQQSDFLYMSKMQLDREKQELKNYNEILYNDEDFAKNTTNAIGGFVSSSAGIGIISAIAAIALTVASAGTAVPIMATLAVGAAAGGMAVLSGNSLKVWSESLGKRIDISTQEFNEDMNKLVNYLANHSEMSLKSENLENQLKDAGIILHEGVLDLVKSNNNLGDKVTELADSLPNYIKQTYEAQKAFLRSTFEKENFGNFRFLTPEQQEELLTQYMPIAKGLEFNLTEEDLKGITDADIRAYIEAQGGDIKGYKRVWAGGPFGEGWGWTTTTKDRIEYTNLTTGELVKDQTVANVALWKKQQELENSIFTTSIEAQKTISEFQKQIKELDESSYQNFFNNSEFNNLDDNIKNDLINQNKEIYSFWRKIYDFNNIDKDLKDNLPEASKFLLDNYKIDFTAVDPDNLLELLKNWGDTDTSKEIILKIRQESSDIVDKDIILKAARGETLTQEEKLKLLENNPDFSNILLMNDREITNLALDKAAQYAIDEAKEARKNAQDEYEKAVNYINTHNKPIQISKDFDNINNQSADVGKLDYFDNYSLIPDNEGVTIFSHTSPSGKLTTFKGYVTLSKEQAEMFRDPESIWNLALREHPELQVITIGENDYLITKNGRENKDSIIKGLQGFLNSINIYQAPEVAKYNKNLATREANESFEYVDTNFSNIKTFSNLTDYRNRKTAKGEWTEKDQEEYLKALKRIASGNKEVTLALMEYTKAAGSAEEGTKQLKLEQALLLSEYQANLQSALKDYKDTFEYFEKHPLPLTGDLTPEQSTQLSYLIQALTETGIKVSDPDAVRQNINEVLAFYKKSKISSEDIYSLELHLNSDSIKEQLKDLGYEGDNLKNKFGDLNKINFSTFLKNLLAAYTSVTKLGEKAAIAKFLLANFNVPSELQTTLKIIIDADNSNNNKITTLQKEKSRLEHQINNNLLYRMSQQDIQKKRDRINIIDKKIEALQNKIPDELPDITDDINSYIEAIQKASFNPDTKTGGGSNKDPTKLDVIDYRTEKDMWEKSIENLDKVIKLADTEYEMATTLEDKEKATNKKLNAIAQKKIDSANLRNEAYNRYIKYSGMNLWQALTDYAPEIFGTAEATKIGTNINTIKTKIPAIGNLIDQMLQTSDPDLMRSLYNKIIPHINEYNTKHPDNQLSFDSKFIDTFFNKQSNAFGEMQDAEVRYKNSIKEELDTRIRSINTRKQELEYIEKAIELQKEYNDILYGEDNYSDEAINATFENIYKGLSGANITLAETEGFINELTELSKNPDINGFTDDMKNNYQELANKYFEGVKAIQNYVTVSFEKLNNIYDEYSEKIKNNMDYLQSLVNITESYYNIFDKLSKITDPLTGKALFTDYNTLVKTRKIQEDFNMAITVQQRDRVREQQTLLQQAAEGLARAQAGNNQRLIKQAQDYYDKIKEQAQEAEEEFISSISEAIDKTFENLADSISRLFTETTKDLYAVGDIEDFNKNMELRNQLEDEYLDEANKEYELNKLQRQIQQEISKNNTLLTRTKLGDLMREITEAQKSSTELSKTELTFLQKKYQLRLAEIALEEAQNNKTSMRLVRNSRGQYDYVFTADQAAIDSAQQKLEDAQIDLHNTARDLLKQALTDTNSMLSSFGEEMSSAQTLEEQQEIQARYLRQLEIYDNRIKRAEEALGPELFAQLMQQYGANETTPQQFINRVTGTINSFAAEAGVLAQQATERVSNYAKILGSVTEEGIFDSEKMLNRVTFNFNLTEQAIEEDSREMTEKIKDVWNNLKVVIDKINEINWDTVAKNLKQYLDQIERFSDKSDELEKNTRFSVKGSSGNDVYFQDKNGNYVSQLQQNNIVNNKPKFKITSGSISSEEAKQTISSQPASTIKLDGNNNVIEVNGQKVKDPYIFTGATGGYTGDFDGGKLGILHEKELVLNKEDTSNILEAVSLVRQMAGSILKDARDRANLMRYFTANQVPNFKYPSAQHDLNQNVSIEANFPNVSSAAEIEEALDNLINQSAQYGQIYQD